MAPVTISRVQRLAELHRRAVPGADEQLEALVQDHNQELCGLLALPLGTVTTEQIVARVEGLTARAKGERQRAARARTEELAELVAAHAQHLPDGSIDLPADSFALMARAGGYRFVRFRKGARVGIVELGPVRQFLRTCRNVTLREMRLTAAHLAIGYDTTCGTGRIAFIVGQSSQIDDAVTVDFTGAAKSSRPKRPAWFLEQFARALQDALA